MLLMGPDIMTNPLSQIRLFSNKVLSRTKTRRIDRSCIADPTPHYGWLGGVSYPM